MRRNATYRLVPFFALAVSFSGALLGVGAPINIASFTSGTGNNFAYVSSGGASYVTTRDATAGTLSVSLPITFQYHIENGYTAALTSIPATLTLQGTVAAPVTTQPLGGGMSMLSETLAGVTLSIIATAPVGGNSNLLTMNSSVGKLSGLANGQTLSMLGNEGAEEKVAFTSDFLSTAQWTEEGFALSFTSVTPKVAVSGGYLVNSDFHGEATFAATQTSSSVPEPGSALLVLAGLGLTSLRRRR